MSRARPVPKRRCPPGRLLVAALLLALGGSPRLSGQVYRNDPFGRRSAAQAQQRAAREAARKKAEAQARKDLQKPRMRLPLIFNTGAWEWVSEIARRLVRSTELELYVPTLEERAILGGKLPGPTPKLPSDEDRGVLSLFLIQDSTVNAFASSNNRIYVTRGLLEFVRSDDELAGVIGHEIGHLTGGHHRRLARKQGLLTALGTIGGILASKKGDGVLPGLALGRTLGLRYNREAEHDADRRGLAMMKDAGYHPVGMLEFMEHLGARDEGNPEDPLSVFFSTHPPTAQRATFFRREVVASGGLQAPSGLSFDFSRNLYSPGMYRGPPRSVQESASTTAASSAPAPYHLTGLLSRDFTWRRDAIQDPIEVGLPEDAAVFRFQGWDPLPEAFERIGGRVIPGRTGLMLSPGATLLGPSIPLDENTSYLVSCRLQGVGEKLRAFVGLELFDEDGMRVGNVYPACPGIFLDEEERRLSGVTHPFGRLEASRGRPPREARLVVRTGRRGEGQVILGELACLPVGRDDEIWREVGKIRGSELIDPDDLFTVDDLMPGGGEASP